MMSLWQMKKLGNNLDSPCPLFSRIVDIIFARFATISDEGKTATNIGRIAAIYDSIATVGEIRLYWRANFQSGSRVLKKVF